jgi:tRNA pseudouridine38-40 synthase
MRLAFRFSYIGDAFFGSQMQPDQRTVEGEFIAACERSGLFEDWRSAGFRLSGRTDRGVHARAQVAAFSTQYPERAHMALNYHLPPDCWCTGCATVGEGFNPRYDAVSRTYRYYFLDDALDARAMSDAAAFFVGTHDFSRFARTQDNNPLRHVLSARVFSDDPFVVFEVTGESFLWNMVRCMATALQQVGHAQLEAESLVPLLEGRPGRRVAGAPAEGLILWNVDCGVPFADMPMDEGRRVRLKERIRALILKRKVLDILSG